MSHGKRIYVTGSETASVFEQRDADHYEHLAESADGLPCEILDFCARTENDFTSPIQVRESPMRNLALQIFEVQ